MSYNPQDSINIAYDAIQSQRAKGVKYGNTPIYNISKSDLIELKKITDKYGMPLEWMINLIRFETGGTFNPEITNSIGATGLIQFLKSTAQGLGTTTDALRKMTFKQQLVYVDKYLYTNLKQHLTPQGKVPNSFTQGDLFMTIFYPVAVGNPNYRFSDKVSNANAGIRTPKDYVERALKTAIFPLSLVPYTLSDVKKKFGEAYDYTKKNWLPIGIVIIGLAGLVYYVVKSGKVKLK